VGIFERLEDVIKSYLNNDGGRPFPSGQSGDSDLNAAYEELDEFLNTGKSSAGGFRTTGSPAGNTASDNRSAAKPPPEELRGDFAELGVPFGAQAGECKTAYKQLLKKHHPDRHAGHPGNMQKATEKSARVNAAFDRIEKWRTTSG
jgi:DnaJ-domain-containing protein 1